MLNSNQTVRLVAEIEGEGFHLKQTLILIHILLGHFLESFSEHLKHSSVKFLRGTGEAIKSKKSKEEQRYRLMATYLQMNAASRIIRERSSLAFSSALASKSTKGRLSFFTISSLTIFSAFLLSNPRTASIRYTQLAISSSTVVF